VVSADGDGVVSHAGSRLLADLADQTTLTAQLSAVFTHRTAPQTAHDPGRVLTDLAVMIADGGECISDIATLADQPGVFGPVGSDSTCWRVLNSITAADLDDIAAARAAARAVAWAQRAELTGQALPASLVAGRPLLDAQGRPVLIIDEDATITIAHSEKEQAAATFKHTWGYHPVLAFCDNTNEALAGMLRPGNAGSNTAADHIAVIDAALAQIPDEHRHGYPILFRFDGAGATKALLAHRSLPNTNVHSEFSVGWAVTAHEHAAIAALPRRAWTDAIDIDGDPRESAAAAELTGLLPTGMCANSPAGTQIIAGRERPTPARNRTSSKKPTAGATPVSPPTPTPGNTLTCVLSAIDLIAWTQTILTHDQPALAKGRTQDTALPTATHSRPTRPRRPHTTAQDRPQLALGNHPRHHLPTPARTANTTDLNPTPATSTGHRHPGNRTRATSHASTRPTHHEDHFSQRRSTSSPTE